MLPHNYNARAIFTPFRACRNVHFLLYGVHGAVSSRLCSKRWSCGTKKVVKASLLARRHNLLQLFVSQLFTLVGMANSELTLELLAIHAVQNTVF